MSKTTVEQLLTRIEILERHVERLETAVAGIIGFGALVNRVETLERHAEIRDGIAATKDSIKRGARRSATRFVPR